MSSPPEVPAAVPPSIPARGPTKPARRAPRYLTAAPSGWRFQYRLPRSLISPDSTPAKTEATIRRWLGPLPIRTAHHKAELLASVCRATASKVLGRQEYGMESGDLVGHVVKACRAATGAALSDPGEALAIAGDLQSALATLNLVAAETATRTIQDPPSDGRVGSIPTVSANVASDEDAEHPLQMRKVGAL